MRDAAQSLGDEGKRLSCGSKEYFCQEYSLTTSEVFIAVPLTRSFCLSGPPTSKESVERYGLILGVDPAGMGADRTAVIFRRGHRITGVETRYDLDTMDTAGRVGQIIRQEQPAGVNIDLGSW